MSQMDGVVWLHRVHEAQPRGAWILLSEVADLTLLLKAVSPAAAGRVLQKPWGDEELLGAVRQCHGHDGGDAAFKPVAAASRSAARDGDTPARLGRGEFLRVPPDAIAARGQGSPPTTPISSGSLM